MKKINVIITNSLGELDVILPIFCELTKSKSFKIKIIFSNSIVYKKFIKELSYVDFCKFLKIQINFSPLFNKFDFRLKNDKLITRLKWRFFKYFFGIYFDLSFWIKNFTILSSNIIMNDASSNILKGTSLDFILFKLLNKKNYVYHHGHSLLQIPIKPTKIRINPNATVLSFHKTSNAYWEWMGYKKIYLVGFPKFYKNWITLIKEYKKYDILDKYILLYTRKIDDHIYMDEKTYLYLLDKSYQNIRKIFKNYKIIIKPHPREDINYIKNIITSKNMKNIEFSTLHASLLAKNSKLIISFWTSAIFDSLSLNIPTVEFYREPKNFRKVEPEGSLNKKIGIHYASDDESLENFLNLVNKNKYIEPSVIKELKEFIDLKIFFTNIY